MSDADFEAGKKSGAINPSTTAKQARQLISVKVTETVTPFCCVSSRGETKSIPTITDGVWRDLEKQRHANETIDTICSVTEDDLEPLAKQLTQDRIADIETFKQSIKLLQRFLDERLGGATIVALPSPSA